MNITSLVSLLLTKKANKCGFSVSGYQETSRKGFTYKPVDIFVRQVNYGPQV